MCFADFITLYEKKYPSEKLKKALENKDVSEETSEVHCVIDSDGNEHKLPKDIKLSNGIFMKLRQNRKILRIYNPRDPFESIYSEMVLFLPWRNETKFFKNNETNFQQHCQNLYEKNIDTIIDNRQKILPFSNIVAKMRDLLDSNDETRPSHIYDNINIQGYLF